MNRIATRTFGLLLLLALCATPLAAQDMKLHKELEANRVKIANEMSKYVVSVEIDYEREPVEAPAFSFPGLGGGPDLSNPFFRYDIGPFSGLVVGPNHILISDRILGEFNTHGADSTVKSITVTLPNGDRWPAEVIGRHQQIDLALLKLDCDVTQCPDLEVVDFHKEKVVLDRGQQVVVIGRGQNPLKVLVNDGIVSALDRENGKAFQLDARIGNATLGAPVVDIKGKLVGMVTLHNHETFGQASGVSNAAYLHEVRRAYELMKEGRFVERPPQPFMGVAASKKWPDKPGLEVGNVVPGTGAEKAGVQVGDIILDVDGVAMNEVEDLITHIQGHEVGDTLKVRLLRGDEEITVEILLGKRP